MSKQKVKKPYSVKKFARELFWNSLVILYIVLIVGNAFVDNLSDIFVRYIPIAISGFLLTYIITKNGAKKLKKADKGALKKKSFILPIIIAVLMLLQGLYSVSVYIETIRNEYENFSSLLVLFEDSIETARKEANLHWVVTSISYLVFAELGAFLISKKLDKFLQEDEIELVQEENVIDNDEKFNLATNEVESTSVNNTIKWDL